MCFDAYSQKRMIKGERELEILSNKYINEIASGIFIFEIYLSCS